MIVINDKRRIAVHLENGSCGELDVFLKGDDEDVQKWNPIGDSIFWFTRLKAIREGKGDGTKIMKELVKIFDERKASVICGVNPYGKMSREDLIKFYEKFGFVEAEDGFMIRNPKC